MITQIEINLNKVGKMSTTSKISRRAGGFVSITNSCSRIVNHLLVSNVIGVPQHCNAIHDDGYGHDDAVDDVADQIDDAGINNNLIFIWKVWQN